MQRIIFTFEIPPFYTFYRYWKKKLGTFSRYSSCFVCYVEIGHSSRERVFVNNRLWQNVSNAFKVVIETILLREQWFLHVGLTLCYEGRETTASDRLLFYRACTSKWRLRQNAFITSLPLDSQKTLGLWGIQRRGGKVNPACAWPFLYISLPLLHYYDVKMQRRNFIFLSELR